ncbi:hypothetical protein GCM10009830_24630 [Glycomyces endophyticus]|uniref:Uncharacterized protein n=1 Tax=Glycomyces endophyticus TaxID=480996 RepID=A0ABN2GUA3_9ACTN
MIVVVVVLMISCHSSIGSQTIDGAQITTRSRQYRKNGAREAFVANLSNGDDV